MMTTILSANNTDASLLKNEKLSSYAADKPNKMSMNYLETGLSSIMSPPLSANLTQSHLSQELENYSHFKTYQNNMPINNYCKQYTVPETPKSVYDEPKIDEQMTNYEGNREDIFRFEPEDIARLTFSDNCGFIKNEYTETPYTPQTPYTPFSNNYVEVDQQQKSQNSSNTISGTADALDIEYINYDEINCQSKNQSPCSSPNLDPWIMMNLKDQVLDVPNSQSPKLNNNVYFEQNFEVQKTKLPSMLSTFGTPQYEPMYGYETQHINYPHPQEHQHQHQHQHEFHQNSLIAQDYDHLPENYENSNIISLEKPNREHKIIWTIDELDEINDELMNDFGYNQQPQNQLQLQVGNDINANNSVNSTDDEDENIINFFAANEIVDNDNANIVIRNTSSHYEQDDGVATTTENEQSLTILKQQQNIDEEKHCNQLTELPAAFFPQECLSSSATTVPQLSAGLEATIFPQKRLQLTLNDAKQQQQQQQQQQNQPQSEHEAELEQPMVCLWTDCNEMFPNQAEFVAHIEKCHVDVKKGDDFSCFWLDCPRRYKPFNARYKLLIHMRVHSGEKPNKCPFPSCNKAFSRLENLKIHQRSHTGERPYGCQYKGCLKAFSNSSDRAKHQRTHYDTKPYACQLPGCLKRYTDPSSLRKHVKNHALRNANGHFGRRKSTANIKSIPTTTVNSGNVAKQKLRRHSESSLTHGNDIIMHNNKKLENMEEIEKRRTERRKSCSEYTILENKEQMKCNSTEYYATETTIIGETTSTTTTETKNNSMNFNELSNCIVTIEHNQNENSIAAHGIQRNLHENYNNNTNTTNTGQMLICASSSSKNINQINELQQLYNNNQDGNSNSSNETVDKHIVECTTLSAYGETADRDEFMTLEYVKKLLSETMDDYMVDCDASTTATATGTAIGDRHSVNKQLDDDSAQDFVNTFMDIDYLTSLI